MSALQAILLSLDTDYSPNSECPLRKRCQRYQKEQPVMRTTNKPYGEWGQVFAGAPVMASAALDRLLHRSTEPGRSAR